MSYSASVAPGDFLTACIGLGANASVASITDTIGGRWIQTGFSYNTNGGAEIWSARGVHGGTTTVTVALTSSAAVGVSVAEWSGIQYRNPLDQWSQNLGTSGTIATQAVTPRTNGDLFLAAVAGSSALTAGPTNSYTALTTGGTGNGAGYFIASGSVSSATTWTQTSSGAFAAVEACFLEGAAGLNPNLQFPETQIQISTQGNYQAPLVGTGVWTEIGGYVQSFTAGPLGRQHELDRAQASAGQLVCDNRTTGVFNAWNTSSFLYNNGLGLRPMNPIRIAAAWNGTTSPVAYGYLKTDTTTIQNVVDVDATLEFVDIFQMLSLKYLSNDNYAQLVMADGGADLVAYYRLGDPLGNYSVKDSSGNGATGSLISGIGGPPAYGAAGAFIYDPNTALDCTNGTNSPSGGFSTIDNTTQPPTVHDPLGSNAGTWTFEAWGDWTQSSHPQPAGDSGNVPNGILLHANSVTPSGYSAQPMELQVGWVGFSGIAGAAGGSFLQVFGENPGVVSGAIPATIFDGDFHHYVFVSSSSPAFYVDGLPIPMAVPFECSSISGVSFGSPANSISPLTGTADFSVLASGWPGEMQDVALYSKALTAEQIANHYETGQWFRQQEFGASVGPQSASVGRLNKVIAVSGLPQSILNVPYPFHSYLYAETNAVTTSSGLNYIQTLTETEAGGIIYQGQNGQINAYSRQYFYLSPESTGVQAIFGDNTNTSLHYESDIQITLDDLDLWSDYQIESGRSGAQLQEYGPSQSATLQAAASIWGQRTLQGLTSLQFAYDGDALATAENYAEWYSKPTQRVQQISLYSTAAQGANIPAMLGLGIFAAIEVQYQGQTAGNQFSQTSLIEQITHSADLSQPIWNTQFALSPFELTMDPVKLGTWTFGTSASVAVLTL